MSREIRLNKNKSIGQVIYIVEGEVTETELLKHIFIKLLNYSVVFYNKKNNDYISLQGENKYSKVFIIPSKYSALARLEPSDYLDMIYSDLSNSYNLDLENSSTFFLFDRDRRSNKKTVVEKLLTKLSSSKVTNDNNYEMNGLLLLSYPCIESFLLQANSDKKQLIDGIQAKQYVEKNSYKIENINEFNLLEAASNMLDIIEIILNGEFNISSLDAFQETNLNIFNYEESSWKHNKFYKTLSLITASLLDLQIIELND